MSRYRFSIEIPFSCRTTHLSKGSNALATGGSTADRKSAADIAQIHCSCHHGSFYLKGGTTCADFRRNVMRYQNAPHLLKWPLKYRPASRGTSHTAAPLPNGFDCSPPQIE